MSVSRLAKAKDAKRRAVGTRDHRTNDLAECTKGEGRGSALISTRRVPRNPTPPRARKRAYSGSSSGSCSDSETGSGESGMAITSEPGNLNPTASMAVLSKARKKVITRGIQELRDHDQALRNLLTLNAITSLPKNPHIVVFTCTPAAFQDPMIRCVDIGAGAKGSWTPNGAKKVLQEVSPSLVVIAVSYPEWEDGLNHSELIDEVVSHCYLASTVYVMLDKADTTRWAEQSIPMYPIYGLGDASNSEDVLDSLEGWTTSSYPFNAPNSFADVFSNSFVEWLKPYAEQLVCYGL